VIPRTLGPFNAFILLDDWMVRWTKPALSRFSNALKSMHVHSFIDLQLKLCKVWQSCHAGDCCG